MVVYCWPKPDTGLSLTKQNPELIWATLASKKNAQVKVPQRGCNRGEFFPHTEEFNPNATQELSTNCISRTWYTSRYGLKRKNLGQEHTVILWLNRICPSLTLWSFEISSWNFKNWSKWICQIPRVCSFINLIIFSYPLTKSAFLIFIVPFAHNRYFK